MERALSAPGKLFLSGEYAVLWGGTANVAAVGPRGHGYVRRRADREVHLVLAEGRLVGHATPLGVHWRAEIPPAFAFAARAIDIAFRARMKESLGLEVALSPSMQVEGRKLGFGGSARACVLAAESARYVLEEPVDALKLALVAHAVAQGGIGSGADVAAIFAGGVIRYRRYPVEPLIQASNAGQLESALAQSPPVDLWRLPSPRVRLVYAFAGESAATPSLVQTIEQKLTGARRDAFILRSDELGRVLEDAMARGDFGTLAPAVGELHQRLCELGPLETEPIRQIVALAESRGCVGKISGAGGGDGCVLFAPDAERQNELVEALRTRGFFAMPVELEPGLRGEARPEQELVKWLGA